MGRVQTNNVSVAYCIETSLGVAGNDWFLLEPNSFGDFGANITTVSRDPISKNRQRRKGTVTDLDSSVGYDEDLTLSSFRNFIEGFCFANGINRDVTQLVSTGAETTGDTYTGLTALTAAQADKFEIDTLIWVDGFVNAGNNGLKVLDADAATSATSLAVAENLVDESGATARISFAGHRIGAVGTVTWTWDGGASTGTLAETGIGTALAALGLTVGQIVHIGSVASLGGAIQNAFENSSANDMYGYARVKTINANDVVFDRVDAALQFTDATDPATPVDIVFGEFIRNVATDASDYLERSFQFEQEFPNLGSGGSDMYGYSLGNFANTMAITVPITNKATVAFGFIGTDTENPTASRKTGASAATEPTQTDAFNTSADVARLRVADVDESGLSTDFKSLTITLNNNVTPEKVIAQLGARFMNAGNFEVDIEATLLFSEAAVVNRIRENTTVMLDVILRNDDGIIAVDLPSVTLGGGTRQFPVNESVTIDITAQAFQDDTLGTSIGVSILPVPLP